MSLSILEILILSSFFVILEFSSWLESIARELVCDPVEKLKHCLFVLLEFLH